MQSLMPRRLPVRFPLHCFVFKQTRTTAQFAVWSERGAGLGRPARGYLRLSDPCRHAEHLVDIEMPVAALSRKAFDPSIEATGIRAQHNEILRGIAGAKSVAADSESEIFGLEHILVAALARIQLIDFGLEHWQLVMAAADLDHWHVPASA